MTRITARSAALQAMLTLFLLIILPSSGAADSGRQLYSTSCAQCHGIEGQGFRKLYPPLIESKALSANPAKLPCLIRYGIKGTIPTTSGQLNLSMPGNPRLGPQELSELINYLRRRFASVEGAAVSPAQVTAMLENCF